MTKDSIQGATVMAKEDPRDRQWRKLQGSCERIKLIHVVDRDLTKCFHRLDHEFRRNEMAKQVSAGRVLHRFRTFLKAGVQKDGSFENTEIGSPQGGVISAFLRNV